MAKLPDRGKTTHQLLHPEQGKQKGVCGYSWIYYAKCPYFGIRVLIDEQKPRCANPISGVCLEDTYCLSCLRRSQKMERVTLLALRQL